MPSGCVYEMFSDNAKCNKTYIGSTTGSLRARLASHKYARHPIFTFGDADVRVLEKDIPAGELHQRKSAYMREKRDGLFNSRVAGRSQEHTCHENVERVEPTAELNIRRSGTAAMVTTDNSIITSSTRKEYCVRRASRMLERAARCLRSAVSTSINLRYMTCVAWFDHFTHTIGSEEIVHVVHQRRRQTR